MFNWVKNLFNKKETVGVPVHVVFVSRTEFEKVVAKSGKKPMTGKKIVVTKKKKAPAKKGKKNGK